jgi:hypothetical protein
LLAHCALARRRNENWWDLSLRGEIALVRAIVGNNSCLHCSALRFVGHVFAQVHLSGVVCETVSGFAGM